MKIILKQTDPKTIKVNKEQWVQKALDKRLNHLIDLLLKPTVPKLTIALKMIEIIAGFNQGK